MRNLIKKIITPNLIIRQYELSDAAQLKEAIDSSLPELSKWMPWASKEPSTIEEKQDRIRYCKGNYYLDQDYAYGIFKKDNQTLVGSVGLHRRRGDHILEVGYWIRTSETGKGYATEASYAMTKVGLENLRALKIEIRCDQKNVASCKIPEKLGFRLDHTCTLTEKDESGNRASHMVWVMFDDEFTLNPKYEPIEMIDEVEGSIV